MSSRLYQNNPARLPIYVAIPVLFAIIFSLFYAGNNYLNSSQQNTRSNDSFILKQVIIGNIQPKNVTIFWETEKSVDTWISYKKSSEKKWQDAYDTRKSLFDGKPKRYHLANLQNLENGESYDFQIKNNKHQENKFKGSSLEFKTSQTLNAAKESLPIYGKSQTETKQALEGVVVVMSTSGASPLIASTKLDGSFLFSTCCLVDYVTLDSPKILEKSSEVKLDFFTELSSDTNQILTLADASPLLEPVILGRKADTKNLDVVQLAPASTESTVKSIDLLNQELIVEYPKNNKSIPGTRPLVAGIARPNLAISLNFKNAKKEFELISSPDGKWQFSPTFDLAPGAQTLIVTATLPKGKKETKSIDFVIQKSGEAVLGAVLQATDEAKITTSPTIAISTPIPTEVITTLTPTIFVTNMPTPPVSGSDVIMPAFLIIGGIVLFGLTLVLGF